MADNGKRMRDAASQEALKAAEARGATTALDRYEAQQPSCRFGKQGICCRLCNMGPCRVGASGKGERYGVCGANADTVAARNLLRMIAAGCAAHSDHGRDVAHTFILMAQGKAKDYRVKDEAKLRKVAAFYGIDSAGKSQQQLALAVGEKALSEFGQQEGELKLMLRAPEKRVQIWRKLGLMPRGIDREIVECMHRTHMGVDTDYRNLLRHGMRTALGDGWGGSQIATELQDIMLGSPRPIRAKVNLGVLSKDKVNVVVHGHEPILSEMLVEASREPEMLKFAEEKGAKGIQLAGICCTANEVLMRQGVPVAGNFLQQELAIVTGAVELMITDVQCCMASLPSVARCYHTQIVTTNPIARNLGAEHVEFNEHSALACAKTILHKAIANFPRRDPRKVAIPDVKHPLVAGFSNETIFTMLGGTFRRSFRPLNDAIITGRIRGIAGIVGCTNARGRVDDYIVRLTRELIKRNVLVLQTGCAAVACGKQGLLTPEAALEQAGPSLREVCEAVGIPPVLHMGSCVDNSRILMAATYVVQEGGLGNDLSQLPAIGAAPEWMSEKAVAIAHYFVASGVDVVLGRPFHTLGSEALTQYLCEGLQELVGARFHYIADVDQAIETMCTHIERKRDALGINRKAERKLYDMKDRRALDV